MSKPNGIKELYELGVQHCKDYPKYTVKNKNVRKLISAKESLKPAKGEYHLIKNIIDLTHPPCVIHALIHGVVDGKKSNRNLVTMFLAGYMKTIDRDLNETTDFLTFHALNKLAKFSSSSPRDIELSTQTAVKTIFNTDKYSHNCNFARSLGFDCNPSCEIYSEYKKIEYGKKTIDLPEIIDKDEKKLVFDTPNKLRQHMIETINNYVFDLRKDKRKRCIKPLLVKAPAGSGKTVTTFDWVSNSGLRCVWIGSQLSLFENIPPEYRPVWRQIRGRQGEHIKDNTKIAGNCYKTDLAAFLRDRNLNVHKHLCEPCEYYNKCDYFKQFEDSENHWFVQQPMFLFKVKKNVKDFDVVVFDEDIMAQFKSEFKIKLRDFKDVLLWIDENYNDLVDMNAPSRVIKPNLSLKLLMDTFVLLLEDKDMGYPLSGTTLRKHLQLKYENLKFLQKYKSDPYRFLIPKEFIEIFAGLDSDRRDYLNHIFIDVENPKFAVPFNFTKEFINILEPELSRADNKSHLSRFSLEKSGKEPIITLNFKHPAPPKSKPTIILDATAKPIIYESLFEIKPTLYEPHLQFLNEVIQIYSTAGGITSLQSNPLHRKRMLEVLRKLVKKERNSLIICKQNMEKFIKQLELVPDNMVTHFYGNRGSNEFESAKQVIIFGAPGYPEILIRKYAAAFFHTENLSATTNMEIKQYHNTTKGIKVVTYKDPHLQAILEISREDEIYQSLSRIRPILDKTKKIIIVSNIVIPELPVSKLLSINDVVGYSFTKTESKLKIKLRAMMMHHISIKQFCIPSWDIRVHFNNVHRTTLDRNLENMADEMGLKRIICHYKNETHGNRIAVFTAKSFTAEDLRNALEMSKNFIGEIESIVEKT